LNQLWREAFPKIKIQKFVAVQTKCNTCSFLDDLAQRFGKNKEFLAELRELRQIHAGFYRAQRGYYHDCRQLAYELPSKVMSCIGDGMAQSHNILPSYGK
jgi:hypothetical protein